MFISTLELFKIGIGPSSSHTLGPMLAASHFLQILRQGKFKQDDSPARMIVTLKGSLSFTGKGHNTDKALVLGLHGFEAKDLLNKNVPALFKELQGKKHLQVDIGQNKLWQLNFTAQNDILYDQGPALSEHPNGMIFEVKTHQGTTLISQTYFSIGGGFIHTQQEMHEQTIKIVPLEGYPYPFDSANKMLTMATKSSLGIASMKRKNELTHLTEAELNTELNEIWSAMKHCLELGLENSGTLPGGLSIERRAQQLHQQLIQHPQKANVNDWLCAYAMAVNEENAAGHMVVTAPTNGAAGVIPAVIYYWLKHLEGTQTQVREFLLTAAAIGGIIKHRSSISGAEVGCQGEVGSAAAMAAAGLCSVMGGSPQQIENAAEIALEHHLGMTCDPVKGLVQVPCIERNGFGAIKAFTAASLALHGSGQHFMSLDNCIAAMRQTGEEMSAKYKETALGGLAVNFTEC